jgi:NADH-quinone oxidoreductase subunit G
MPETKLVNIKIDGVALQAPEGESVIEAAKRINIDIPFFCYHPRLSMAEGGANCRMCLVDVAMPRKNPDGTVTVAKMPKPQTACSLPVAEGMEIQTESEGVVKDRRGVLEFLLINHPLDCPICDRGGECPLQNNTLHYGPPTSRFIEEKRHFPKAYPLSDYVVFDRERCIHCARCTRFTRDISGDSQLDFLFRGADMEVGTFAHTEFQSKFSGNVIELCPVGALLSRTYRFKARPWDLLTQKSICTECSNGCNVKFDYRVSKLQRVNARENDYVNEEWTCDKGKFGMDYVSSDDRLTTPMVRQGNAFRPASWEEANRLILRHVQDAGTAIGGIGGSRTPNEDLYVWQRFFRERLGVNNLDHRMGPHFPPTSVGLLGRYGYNFMSQSIADLENMRTVLVFGSNLVDEQPMLFLRIRKAWRFKGTNVVEAVPQTLDEDAISNHVSEFASVSLRYRPGTEIALIGGLLNVLFAEKLLVDENGAALPGVEAYTASVDVSGWTPDKVAVETGVSEDAIRRAARLLAGGNLSIIAGNYVSAHPYALDVVKALGNLAVITGNAGNLNLPSTENNQQGAMDMGILPDSLPGYIPAETSGLSTEQMLRAAAAGDLKMLWVVGGDLVNDFHDRELAVRGLENSPFTVVHALSLNDTAKMADVVLPVQSVAERDGTFTNVERRVQRFHKAFEISPDVVPDWFVFAQIAGLMGQPLPYTSSRDILRDIVANVPIYKDCGPRQLGDLGVRWEYPEAGNAEHTVSRVEYKSPAPEQVTA